MKPSQLNVVFRITAVNGYRREWDMEFRDGVPRHVTLAAYSPDGTVVTTPGPVLISAETFFERFFKEWEPIGETP